MGSRTLPVQNKMFMTFRLVQFPASWVCISSNFHVVYKLYLLFSNVQFDSTCIQIFNDIFGPEAATIFLARPPIAGAHSRMRDLLVLGLEIFF